mgnify:FL=1
MDPGSGAGLTVEGEGGFGALQFSRRRGAVHISTDLSVPPQAAHSPNSPLPQLLVEDPRRLQPAQISPVDGAVVAEGGVFAGEEQRLFDR